MVDIASLSPAAAAGRQNGWVRRGGRRAFRAGARNPCRRSRLDGQGERFAGKVVDDRESGPLSAIGVGSRSHSRRRDVRCALLRAPIPPSGKPLMNEIGAIGIDLAENVFPLHGVDAAGAVVVRRTLRWSQMPAFFAKLGPCLTWALPDLGPA